MTTIGLESKFKGFLFFSLSCMWLTACCPLLLVFNQYIQNSHCYFTVLHSSRKFWECVCGKIRSYTKQTIHFFYFFMFLKMAIRAPRSELQSLATAAFRWYFHTFFSFHFEALICINWFLSHGMSYLPMWRSQNFRRILACFSFPMYLICCIFQQLWAILIFSESINHDRKSGNVSVNVTTLI